MAVTQVSKIQIRSGLQSDIGQLDTGELGWAIDTQRLYIGNGTVDEGAPFSGLTELMTSAFDVAQILGNYNYKGYAGGYEVITGVNESTPVVRPFQDKIDDFVNVKDFGGSSSGNVDETAAIQRAMDELYNRKSPITGQRTRRQLRFSAGTYRIDGELRIPPYVTFVGDGMDSVKLILNGPGLRLVTSTGTDANLLSTIPDYPQSVSIQGMTIQAQTDTTLFFIDGARNIVFDNVAFVGPKIKPTTLGNNGSCVRINSTVVKTSSVYFNQCTFRGATYGVRIIANVDTQNIIFNNCQYSDLVYAVYTDSDIAIPKKIKISSSVFEDIYNTAIYGDVGVSGIISLGNTFKNVGSRYQGDSVTGPQLTPVIIFQADNNYSIADIFERSLTVSAVMPRVQSQGYRVSYMSVDDGLGLGTSRIIPGKQVALSSGQAELIPVVASKHGIINYSAVRNQDVRSGIIKFSSQNGTVSFDDEYSETTDMGLVINLVIDNGVIKLNCATANNGFGTTLNFDVKTLS